MSALFSSDGRAARKNARRDSLVNTSLRKAMHPSTPAGASVATALVLILLWAIVGVDSLADHRLLRFGLKPRELGGLWGILTEPLLHADAGQLAANTIAIAVLAWLMFFSGLRSFLLVTAASWLVSGVIGWVAGPTHHLLLGASGVLFGWLGYVLARAWFGRQIKWIAIAVAVVTVFSGLFSGLVPALHDNVFWGAQLAGFLTGAAIGAVLHKRPPKQPKQPKVRRKSAA